MFLGTSASLRKALHIREPVHSFCQSPLTFPHPILPSSLPLQISDLPAWAQPAFAGFEKLNRIQSRIYPTAFNSNENILVCAPTGELGPGSV